MTHKTRKFVSVLSQADLFEQEGGGMVVSLPSNAVSGRELKKTLDTMFQPAEYSVRVCKTPSDA